MDFQPAPPLHLSRPLMCRPFESHARSVCEAERLRAQLAAKEAALREAGETLTQHHEASAMAMEELANRLACAEADARNKDVEIEQLAAARH